MFSEHHHLAVEISNDLKYAYSAASDMDTSVASGYFSTVAEEKEHQNELFKKRMRRLESANHFKNNEADICAIKEQYVQLYGQHESLSTVITPALSVGRSVSLNAGDFALVIGSNSSGKSTLMSLIAGQKKPYEGNVKISYCKSNALGSLEKVSVDAFEGEGLNKRVALVSRPWSPRAFYGTPLGVLFGPDVSIVKTLSDAISDQLVDVHSHSSPEVILDRLGSSVALTVMRQWLRRRDALADMLHLRLYGPRSTKFVSNLNGRNYSCEEVIYYCWCLSETRNLVNTASFFRTLLDATGWRFVPESARETRYATATLLETSLVNRLSSGQKQRAQFLLALIQQPIIDRSTGHCTATEVSMNVAPLSVIVLDECSTDIDVAESRCILEVASRECAGGEMIGSPLSHERSPLKRIEDTAESPTAALTTGALALAALPRHPCACIYVTHILNTVAENCSHLMLLRKGAIDNFGKIRSVLKEEAEKRMWDLENMDLERFAFGYLEANEIPHRASGDAAVNFGSRMEESQFSDYLRNEQLIQLVKATKCAQSAKTSERSSRALILVHNLNYGGVIGEFSLSIYKGARILLLGNNGCGKSTFLSILGGKTLFFSRFGTMGRDSAIQQWASERANTFIHKCENICPSEGTGAQNSISYILVNGEVMYDSMRTVHENITYCGDMWHITEDSSSASTRGGTSSCGGGNIIEVVTVGFSGDCSRGASTGTVNTVSTIGGEMHVSQLIPLPLTRRAYVLAAEILDVDMSWDIRRVSTGQLRRVQLLLMLYTETPVVLIDEATSNLDMHQRYKLLLFLYLDSVLNGTCILYATHIFDALAGWATNVIIMNKVELKEMNTDTVDSKTLSPLMLKKHSIRKDNICKSSFEPLARAPVYRHCSIDCEIALASPSNIYIDDGVIRAQSQTLCMSSAKNKFLFVSGKLDLNLKSAINSYNALEIKEDKVKVISFEGASEKDVFKGIIDRLIVLKGIEAWG